MQAMMTEGTKEIILKDEERQRCEVWTRVMGYHRPVSEFNPGKKGEHYERTHFVEPKGCEKLCSG
ncbi:MAG: oxidoreductase [Candidatus Omnitrophica bacterium]|nr:oxidoreductase [Candidatus Omnitrophota bacterium]